EYWSRQERQSQYGSPQDSTRPLSNPPSQPAPQQTAPQNLSPDDNRRVLQAEAQNPEEDSSSTESPLNASSRMPQLSSDQISQLIRAYMGSQRGTGSGGSLQNVDMNNRLSAVLGGGNLAGAFNPASSLQLPSATHGPAGGSGLCHWAGRRSQRRSVGKFLATAAQGCRSRRPAGTARSGRCAGFWTHFGRRPTSCTNCAAISVS